MSNCKDCHCECHCNDILHNPSDTLDGGGLCPCEECKCNEKEMD